MTTRFVAASLAFFSIMAVSRAPAAELTIGSPAPPIAIEHWFHDKAPITEFKPGQVYVVEFWATWCGPCIASMPHLAEIQKQHADNLTVISVSDEDPEKIEKFLDRETNETTFREITSNYWLTTDPDRSVSQDYMRAAGEGGIPTAFIVGKTGQIEWIGHPMRMDEPIAKILAGEWDRESYAAERAEEKAVRGAMAQIARLMQKNQYEEAIAKIDELIAGVKSDRIRAGLEQGRKRAQAQAEEYAKVQQRKEAESARIAKAQTETVTTLLEVAFLLKDGKVDDATAVLDRMIEASKNDDVKLLLEEARAKLTSE
jgi:thiol-disulfide isomerase/thioredoxin